MSLQQASSVTRTLNLMGDRPRWLIVFGLSLGRHRFSELLSLTGLARSLLSRRLSQLQQEGLIETAGGRRDGYRLTPSGADLQTCLLAMISWDARWCYDERLLAHRLTHRHCQQSIAVDAVCKHCQQSVIARDVNWLNGPGEGLDPRPPARSTRKTGTKSATRDQCFAQILDLLGDRWSALVIAASFFRIRSFSGYQQHIGLASNILSERLSRLCQWEILVKQGSQQRPQYRLSDKGLALYPVILALMQWGDRWLAGAAGAPLQLYHNPCGQALRIEQCCAHCRWSLSFAQCELPELAKI